MLAPDSLVSEARVQVARGGTLAFCVSECKAVLFLRLWKGRHFLKAIFPVSKQK